jgi:hypothetical protein
LVTLGCGTRRPGLTLFLFALDTLFFETIFLFSFTALELFQLGNLFIITSDKVTGALLQQTLLLPKTKELGQNCLLLLL